MQSRLDISSATGVDVQLRIAGPGARSYAFTIDWHIRLLLALAWFVVASLAYAGSLQFPGEESGNFPTYMLVVVVPAIALYALYHLFLEIIMRGRTPGKRMAGVRIVTVDGQEPGFLALFIRNLLRLIDSLPAAYMIGLVVTIATKNSVRIGDLAAGTLLIYETDARGDDLQAAPVSPEAIARFGLQKAELAQDLLNRWDKLENERRVDLAIRLLPQMDYEFKAERDPDLLYKHLNTLLSQSADAA